MFSSWLNEHETLSVLIVEDSQTQANQLRYLLEKHGFARLPQAGAARAAGAPAG